MKINIFERPVGIIRTRRFSEKLMSPRDSAYLIYYKTKFWTLKYRYLWITVFKWPRGNSRTVWFRENGWRYDDLYSRISINSKFGMFWPLSTRLPGTPLSHWKSLPPYIFNHIRIFIISSTMLTQSDYFTVEVYNRINLIHHSNIKQRNTLNLLDLLYRGSN